MNENKKLVIGGDLNAQVCEESEWFGSVHGGQGYGKRNINGEMMLEFADAMELAVMNTGSQRESIEE